MLYFYIGIMQKIKIIFAFIGMLTSSLSVSAQSNHLRNYKKLSKPEKIWVIAHPFKAQKAFCITKEVMHDVDSIKYSGVIGTDNNGGKLDAFKHAYWMAKLTIAVGSKKAKKLGIAHEKGNRLQFQKHQLEESILPDSVSSKMDLYNNEQGICIATYCKIPSSSMLKIELLKALTEGKLVIIKKDGNGNYLTMDGIIIPITQWIGKWDIPKCLIASNKN